MMGEQSDGNKVGKEEVTVDIAAGITRRQQQLNNLGEAYKVLESRSQERYKREQSEYIAKMARNWLYNR
jgi:hypothetical protein